MLRTIQRKPLVLNTDYRDLKDPCPVFDGTYWHIYGSGGSSAIEEWDILHARSAHIDGPWEVMPPVKIYGAEGRRFCAPGVVFDSGSTVFHMFVHTDCFSTDNKIEYCTSEDGENFYYRSTALSSIRDQGSREAGIYDPHPAMIRDKEGVVHFYFTYSGFPDPSEEPNRTDIYLAESESGSWAGPWKRLGPIITQEQVPFQNQHDFHDYEWGMEGTQLLQLKDGRVLLHSVCFLPEGPRGSRQRLFFAIADEAQGPYTLLGPMFDPESDPWGFGENGHAAGFVQDEEVHLLYQARNPSHHEAPHWKYGHAVLTV